MAAPVQAQDAPADTSSTVPEVTIREWPADSLGRRTPRGAVYGFIRAVSRENYTQASRYLNIDSTLQGSEEGEEMARALQRLLDQRGDIMPYSWISDDTQGDLKDNLAHELERVGSATVNKQSFDLLLEKTTGLEGAPVWLFSAQTMQQLPVAAEQLQETPLDRVLPAFMEDIKLGGVPVGHWLAMLVLAVLVYLLAWVITSVVIFIIRRAWVRAREESVVHVMKAFALPIRLYLAVLLLVAYSQEIGISIIVRQWFSEATVLVGLVAVLLLLWRLVDVITRVAKGRLSRLGNLGAFSAVLFLQRGAKIAIVVFGIIAVLSTFGFDVTTGLAALGIGGIALALGAQKTVENFVGSVTLIADQPVRVGDFCKVGETVGTVEAIGMRSTRIRTNDRTVVTIPNGEFSSVRIENYAHRDRFWFHPVLGLRYETTPDQIRYLLVELRALLYAHPKVDPTSARVRFVELGADSLKLEIFSYIMVMDFAEFLSIQEDLYLRIMDTVEASGSGFAFPSQTLYMARDQGLSEEKAQEAAEKVKQWREAGEMQIPNFDARRITELRNTIAYPPDGSSSQVK